MGWTVIARGNIDFPKDIPKGLVDEVFNKMKKKKTSYKDSVFYNLEKCKIRTSLTAYQNIGFEMSGNKGISYDQLDEIKNFILKKLKGKSKAGLTISANEFCEQDGGFYYEYEENEEK